jgi:hypothetical protein
MRINLESIDTEFRKLSVGTRVRLELEVSVESMSLEHISGEVMKSKIISYRGEGGIPSSVRNAEKSLMLLRTMGTNA